MIERSSKAFSLMFVTMLIIVTSFFLLETHRLEKQSLGNLAIIAKLKAESIEQWYRERQSDCEYLAQSNDLFNHIQSLLAHPEDQTARNLLLTRLSALTTVYDYASVTLTQADGQPLLSTDSRAAAGPAAQSLIGKVVATQQIAHSDLFLDANNLVMMDWLIPMADFTQTDHQVVAILILRVHTDHFLFPMIRSWPSLSSSAESILVQRENSSIRLLSELKDAPNATLQLVNPLPGFELPEPAAATPKPAP